MQEGDRVGDMLLLTVVGVGKGPSSLSLLFNSSPRGLLLPTQPFSPHLIFVKAPQAPQYILEVIL